MAVYLNLDEDGYLYGVRMLAHRWDGEKLVLDAARLAELEERTTVKEVDTILCNFLLGTGCHFRSQ